jgi:hypothetical protein
MCVVPRCRWKYISRIYVTINLSDAGCFGLNSLDDPKNAKFASNKHSASSLKGTIDYLLGTLGGAIYAGTVAALIPHPTQACWRAGDCGRTVGSARRDQFDLRRGDVHRRVGASCSGNRPRRPGRVCHIGSSRSPWEASPHLRYHPWCGQRAPMPWRLRLRLIIRCSNWPRNFCLNSCETVIRSFRSSP